MEPESKALTEEIAAMAALGRILGDLTDLGGRQRVLKWACERFGADVSLALGTPETPASALADPGLAVDSLSDMFAAKSVNVMDDDLSEFAAPGAQTPAPQVAVDAKLPLEAVLRSFAADFQRFADEWNGAAA